MAASCVLRVTSLASACAGRADKVANRVFIGSHTARRLRGLPSRYRSLSSSGWRPGASLAQDSDAARIKKLETEVANLRLMVGTLESLVRTAPGTALAPHGSGAAVPSYLEPRVRALETQIAALTNQVEQMGRQVKALEAKLDAKLDAAPEAAKIGVLTSQVDRMGQKVSALQSKLETKLDAAPEPVADRSAPAGRSMRSARRSLRSKRNSRRRQTPRRSNRWPAGSRRSTRR